MGVGGGLVELRLGESAETWQALYGLDYFADPPHTLGEEEEKEENRREFLVGAALSCTTGWLLVTIMSPPFRSPQCPETCTQASWPARGSHPVTKMDYCFNK